MGSRVLVVDDSPTIRKVVLAILQRAAYEPIGAEDGVDALQTLAREQIDLILLDFVMPRMNGYQLCRELRAHDHLKHIPVVLMSAKSDKIRGQFVQQTGAIDAITKPFDARALIAVVESSLARHEEGRGPPLLAAEEMLDEEAVADSQNPDEVDSPSRQEARLPAELGAALADLLAPTIEKPDVLNEIRTRVTFALKSTFSPAAISRLHALMHSLEPGTEKKEALAGDLSVFSVAEVLQMLELQRLSGRLNISNDRSTVALFVRKGSIDFATAAGLRGEFLLGRFLVEDGAISREQLESILAERPAPGLSGQHLVSLGLVDEQQLQQALKRQTSEVVYEVVRWKSGRFEFLREPPEADPEQPRFELSVSALAMEGFRRVDEWRLIESSIEFDEVLHRDEIAIARLKDASKLTKLEREVLDNIDGERTVREIVEASEGSSFVVCKILYQFLNSRLVARSAA